MPPIFACVRYGHRDLLRVLLGKFPALLASEDVNLRFPLHEASSAEVVDTLLELKADIHCEDGIQGATPLHLAMRYGRSEVVRILLQRKAEPWRRDGNGITCVDSCRDRASWDVLNTIVPIPEEIFETG